MRTFVLILFAVVTINCAGGYTSSVTSKDSPGWMRLVGDLTNVTISVDAGQAWSPSKEVDRYELTPGTHELQIYRHGQLILKRAVIITEAIETEVRIP